jgi:hypothetical protein
MISVAASSYIGGLLRSPLAMRFYARRLGINLWIDVTRSLECPNRSSERVYSSDKVFSRMNCFTLSSVLYTLVSANTGSAGLK